MSKEEKRYSKAKQNIVIIEEQYNGYDDLNCKRLEYKNTQNLSLRINHANYVKYRRLKEIIEDFESQMDYNTTEEDSDDDYSFEESNESSHDSIIDEIFEEEYICNNCMRESSQSLVDEFGDLYELDFILASSSSVRKKRKFKFVTATQSTREQWYSLCHECHNHLVVIDDSKEANESRYAFPGFIWSVLSDVKLQRLYGLSLWEYWWLDSTRSFDCFQLATLDHPEAILEDKSNDLNTWDEAIASQTLSQLKKVTNEFLMPNVLCPWGCSDYNHR